MSSTSHTMLKSGFAANDETIGSSTGEGSLLKSPVEQEAARPRGASVESKCELVEVAI